MTVQENNDFSHISVLCDEVVTLARTQAPQLIVDCTLGGAGHARAMLEACPGSKLIGIDRDPTAIAVAKGRLAPFADRVTIVHAAFSDVADVLHQCGVRGCDVLLADLGVSSHQLDTANRGFSFRQDAYLDMRMDTSSGESAADLLATMDEEELANAIYNYGEERHSRRVARLIVANKPTTTLQLATLIRQAVPKSADGIDPATRTFQAIRILVNREMAQLETWLNAVPEVLNDGGLALAISFHSLEDRAVKQAFRAATKSCICPPGLPVCLCGVQPTLELVRSKPFEATSDEIKRNPRARSAKLRAARRLPRVRVS